MSNKITQAEQSPSYDGVKNNEDKAERQRARIWVEGYNAFLNGDEATNSYKDGSKRDVTWRKGYNKAIEESDSNAEPVAFVAKAPKAQKRKAMVKTVDMNGDVVESNLPPAPFVPDENRPNTGFGGRTARIMGRNMGKKPVLVEANGSIYTGSLTLKTFPDPIPDCIPKFMRKHFSDKVTLTVTNDGRYFDASGFPVNPPKQKEVELEEAV